VRIVDHEPHFWFLAEENGSLFVDANCNHSFVGYSFMIELSPEEMAEYKNKGRGYLNWLAQNIQDSAPILAASNSSYKGRDVSAIYSEKLQLAVESWRKTNG
jgi:hypothetical protein